MTARTQATAIIFCGIDLLLYGSGYLYLPDREMLVVSDLHLEKGAAQSSGLPLPAYDTDDTMRRLEGACELLSPKTCLFLGDSFHNEAAAFRLPERIKNRLSALANQRQFIWVTGNHDPNIPAFLPGKSCATYNIDGLVFCHEMPQQDKIAANNAPDDTTSAYGYIFGHFHPKARMRLPAKHVTGRCFIHDNRALIMPAFGAFTGGLNILDTAIQSLLGKPQTVHFCYQDQIYSYPVSQKHFMTG
jgi:DNA ligase-associated metallophosphoesterase